MQMEWLGDYPIPFVCSFNRKQAYFSCASSRAGVQRLLLERRSAALITSPVLSQLQREQASLGSALQLRPCHLLLLLPMAATSKLRPGPSPSFSFPGNAQKS